MATTKEKVLFLCTGNSCRSQMAEGLLRDHAGDRYDVASAGTHPSRVNPLAIRAMNEIGIDISSHRSKSIDDLEDRQFDLVITVCDRARETCPVFPYRVKQLHWSLDDPAEAQGSEEERLEVFRRVRDELVSMLDQLVTHRKETTLA